MTWIKPPEVILILFLLFEAWKLYDFLLIARNLSAFFKNIVIDSLMGLIQ